MEEILSQLLEASRVTGEMSSSLGRSYGVLAGIVSNREDPQNLGRVKAQVAAKGARTETDWLLRAEPCPKLSLPVPQLGDTVWVAYRDGDPHKGMYLGVVQNNVNPAYDKDSLKLQIGDVEVYIEKTGEVIIKGATKITYQATEEIILDSPKVILSSPEVSIEGATSVGINGKQITTLGSVDTGGYINISRGW